VHMLLGVVTSFGLYPRVLMILTFPESQHLRIYPGTIIPGMEKQCRKSL